MKMVSNIGKGCGALVLLVAVMAIITAASLFVVGSYLVMWPVLRLSPRGQKKQAIVNLLASLMAAAQAFAPDPPDPDAPDA